MDLKQTQKLALDKIESDLFTNNVRQSIKQNIRERQNTREAFKDAFEVLLETQESSTKTQKDILEELKKLNNEMRQNIQEQREEPIEEEELSEQEEIEEEEEPPRPHMRLPGFLYRVVTGVNPSTVTLLIRKAIIGTAGIASAIAATKYLGEKLSDRTGNERFGTSFDVMEPSVNALKDNLYKLSTETALTIYNQANLYPESKADISGLSNLIHKGIIGSAGANAALAAYRLIADSLSFDQISRFIGKIKTGLKPPSLSSDVIGILNPSSSDVIRASDILKPPSSDLKPSTQKQLFKPSKIPINLFALPQGTAEPPSSNLIEGQPPQNQPIIPHTFAPFYLQSKKQSPFPVTKTNKPLLPRAPNNFPPVSKLLSTDLRDLDRLSGTLPVMYYHLEERIKTLKSKPRKTETKLDTLQDFLRYRKELGEYTDYFNSHYDMRNILDQKNIKTIFSPISSWLLLWLAIY